jgi:hypothetical protein
MTWRTPRLITSGWWAAVAAALVSGAIVVTAIVATDPDPRGGRVGADTGTNGFDLSNGLVSRDRIVTSGMQRDGLAVLDLPTMLDTGGVDRLADQGRGKFLVPGDRVVGVEIRGDARAYPLRLLRWHEVVNDIIGGVPVVISYNGLCDSVVVADRRVGAEVLDFGISGLLFNSNLLLYDRRPDVSRSSLWSQLRARAVSGPFAGTPLRLLPASLAGWDEWRSSHPETRVLAPLDRLESVYTRDPYHSYFGSDLLRFPVSPLPPREDLRYKDRVVALTVGTSTTVVALPRLASAEGTSRGSSTVRVGEIRVPIEFDVTRGTAVARAPEGVELGVRYAFWFAWYAQHPDTGDPVPHPGR